MCRYEKAVNDEDWGELAQYFWCAFMFEPDGSAERTLASERWTSLTEEQRKLIEEHN